VLPYLEELAQHLVTEQAAWQEELKSLRKSVEHACQILARQQAQAKTSDRRESVPAVELVEEALLMNAHSLAQQHVEVVRDYAPNLPTVLVQKHLVLQILVNLIRNAGQACTAAGAPTKCVTLRLGVSPADRRIKITVQDSGGGIAPDQLARLFTHGFTTRKEGHGFGLHSAERLAREIGGSLTAQSAGVGQGACFILEFPEQGQGGR
jgi:signal transduction histidine kinase